MNKEKLFNGFYNYTVVLTYLNMLCGFMGVISLFYKNFWLATLFLILAGLFDMLDGAVASTRKRTDAEKRFGIQIDSLSDLICFGLFPALFTIVICDFNAVAIICGAAFCLCALMRLAYFNVCEEERQQTEGGRRKYYFGLPVTASPAYSPQLSPYTFSPQLQDLWLSHLYLHSN